ncbi:MAG: bifunctional phosphopantothenoylcysteine decarboxylase/phosphopantothenate--cysteine ligase CoaBC [Actinobacteria bacterium HGW-Actinobacteria-10]|nr:MAG: bifunctional phosphopantothenoylcysteine decarboxylase/phosphopantothenate--cysteine ligase CoaBC [Actinobacteria bacterium HGW-Actinobacteria-10]
MTHESFIPTRERPRTVVLGITGCIAAYKACELTRALVRDGVRVKVIMTEAATKFVGPVTLRTLTGEPVVTSLWDDPGTSPVHHVSLAQETDVLVIAPCTANVLAKIACGRADDMLTTTALATEAPIVIAPAMNTHMWRAEATQANLATLRARGALIVEPGTGELACGDAGEGRLADIDAILTVVRAELVRTRDLEGVRVLVTAGPTRERIDAVRYITNPSSGKTGFSIAEEIARRGGEVTLVSGPVALPDPFGVQVVRVESALEMRDAVDAAYDACDVVVATAAVSDFRPAEPVDGKSKKDSAPLDIPLKRNPDILAGLGKRKGNRILIGFAAETDDVIDYATSKLFAKNLDLVVANDVSDPAAGFGTDANRVWFVSAAGVTEMPLQSKRVIAARIADEIVRLRDALKPKEA